MSSVFSYTWQCLELLMKKSVQVLMERALICIAQEGHRTSE